MSNKILINIIKANEGPCFNAADKARADVEHTLVKNGYQVLNVPLALHLNKLKAVSKHLLEIKKVLSFIKKNKPKKIIFQYPGFRIGIKSIDFMMYFLKKYHVTFLVHDVDSLRFHGSISKREVNLMNKADEVIVHTENMKNYLIENGVKTPMKVMWLFDYYAKGEAKLNEPKTNYSLIFAGNLDKSGFLKKMETVIGSHKLFLYGLPIEYQWPENIEYEGKFAPDEINDLKGDWGLVWDGNSLDRCDGNMGVYLKYNSSHKNSLYIASGKPIIIWKKSGMASFIIKNNLGIAVDSLADINEVLSSISKEDYLKFQSSVEKFQRRLRTGKMLEAQL